MKKKILALVLAALMTVLTMTSCSGKNNTDGGDTPSGTASGENGSSGTTKVGDIEISNDVRSCEIIIDGKLYKMPCKVSELTDAGWEFEYADEMLNANTMDVMAKAFTKGDLKIKTLIVNFDMDSEHAYKDCYVCEIEVSLGDGVAPVLPGGFVFDENTTADSVKAAYGEADYVYEKDDLSSYDYSDIGIKTTFRIYDVDSKMRKYSSVEVKNTNRDAAK